jgi:hypothetical protein
MTGSGATPFFVSRPVLSILPLPDILPLDNDPQKPYTDIPVDPLVHSYSIQQPDPDKTEEFRH